MIYWAPEPDAPIEPEFDLEFESDIMTLSRIKDCMWGQTNTYVGKNADWWAESAQVALDDLTTAGPVSASLLICDSGNVINKVVGATLVNEVKCILDRASLGQLEAWGMAHIVRWIE